MFSSCLIQIFLCFAYTDIDECAEGLRTCDSQSFCRNTEGSSACIGNCISFMFHWVLLLCPAQGTLSDDAVWRLLRTSGQLAACAARCMVRIGWSGPARPAWLKAAAACFCCRPGWGHIMAVTRLQLVITALKWNGTVYTSSVSSCLLYDSETLASEEGVWGKVS